MNRQKPVVLFLIYHGKSHFISSFHLARTIQHTHTVAFAGVEFFRDFVKAQGFTYYPLKSVPFGIGLDEWYNSVTNRKPIFWKTVIDRWTDRLYHIRKKELTQLILTCNPTHILADSMQASDFIVLHKLISSAGIRFSVIHNMLPATYSETSLPLNSAVVPDNKKEIQEAFRKERLKEWKLRWRQRFKYLSPCDHDIITRRIRRNNIPKSFISHEASLFYPVLKGIPQFVMMNREFNFPGASLADNVNFLGSQIDMARNETFNPEYHESESEIKSRISNGARLAYCSLGTLPASNRDSVIGFLRNVVTATKKLGWLLVISFQLHENERSALASGNDHVYLFDSVPQLSVLGMASVFINHGGLNSIKESIDAEVPMLICPAYATYDHHGNTARVVYHKLGMRVDVANPENSITSALNELVSNPDFKTHLRILKSANSNYTIKPFLEFVSS